jgi:hypothetical protein
MASTNDLETNEYKWTYGSHWKKCCNDEEEEKLFCKIHIRDDQHRMFCPSDKNIGRLKQTANATFMSGIDGAIPEYGIFDEKEDKELGINSKNIICAYLEEKKILNGHDYEDYYMGSEKGQETFIELGWLILRDRNVRLTTKIRHLRIRIWYLMFQKVMPMLERYW